MKSPRVITTNKGRLGQTPHEWVIYTPTRSGLYELSVQRFSVGSTVPSWVQLHSRTGQDLDSYTQGHGILNPAESANPGMLAVGAAHYWDVNTIASYSSRGPTPDDRIKPDIVGADCAATSTHGTGNTLTSGQRYWFCGTSQSSPHIAGLAVLVKQRFPEYTPAQIANYLKINAEARAQSPTTIGATASPSFPIRRTAKRRRLILRRSRLCLPRPVRPLRLFPRHRARRWAAAASPR